MPFYPEWVALLDDTARGKKDAALTSAIAQQIIDAIKGLQRERNELRAKLDPRSPANH